MSNSDQWGVGNQADAKAFDKTKVYNTEVELIFGEHPHSRRDDNIYARYPDGHIEEFDGHRRLIDINIQSRNYLKESGLSGDQIRKECVGTVSVDGIQLIEEFGRDPIRMMSRLQTLIEKYQEHESNWFNAYDRAKLPGRKIWYHDQPATIVRLIEDQGCIMIATEPGFKPPRAGDDPEEHDYWGDWKEGDHYEVKDSVLSPHIWWWRR